MAVLRKKFIVLVLGFSRETKPVDYTSVTYKGRFITGIGSRGCGAHDVSVGQMQDRDPGNSAV